MRSRPPTEHLDPARLLGVQRGEERKTQTKAGAGFEHSQPGWVHDGELEEIDVVLEIFVDCAIARHSRWPEQIAVVARRGRLPGAVSKSMSAIRSIQEPNRRRASFSTRSSVAARRPRVSFVTRWHHSTAQAARALAPNLAVLPKPDFRLPQGCRRGRDRIPPMDCRPSG